MAENHSADTILQEALELSDLQERAAYLDEACGDDEALRGEIDSLLAAHFAADAFMDTLADPLWQEAPTEKEGDRIGRYKLLQQIGEAGFGTVSARQKAWACSTTDRLGATAQTYLWGYVSIGRRPPIPSDADQVLKLFVILFITRRTQEKVGN